MGSLVEVMASINRYGVWRYRRRLVRVLATWIMILAAGMREVLDIFVGLLFQDITTCRLLDF